MEMVLSASAEQRGAPRGRKPLTRSRCKLETLRRSLPTRAGFEFSDHERLATCTPGWNVAIGFDMPKKKSRRQKQAPQTQLLRVGQAALYGHVDEELMPIRFKTTAEGKTKCAWPDCVSSSARLYCEYIQRPWRECQLPETQPAQTQGKRVADELDYREVLC